MTTDPYRPIRKTPAPATGRRGLGSHPCLYVVDEVTGAVTPWSYDVEYQAAADPAAVDESGDDLDQGW